MEPMENQNTYDRAHVERLVTELGATDAITPEEIDNWAEALARAPHIRAKREKIDAFIYFATLKMRQTTAATSATAQPAA